MIDDVELCRRTQKHRGASRCFPLELFSSQKVSLGMLFQKYTALKIIWWIRMAVMMKMASVENDNDKEEEEKEEDDNNKDNGNDED